jgi:SAM-dependent methyltransferase
MFSVEEEQVLISTNFAAIEKRGTTIEEIEKAGIAYFCSYKMDWNDAISRLLESEAIIMSGSDVKLNDGIDISAMTRRRPRYKYWYNDWYRMAGDSLAHSRLCEYSYGVDLCQTGMMTKNQIDFLCDSTGVKGHGLDVGCGIGKIAEYINSRTQTSAVGVDTILSGVKAARKRTSDNNELSFELSDMRQYIVNTDLIFDFVISMDTLYFLGNSFRDFLLNSMNKITSDGTLYVFYSAWIGKDNKLGSMDNNLGKFLEAKHSDYTYIDFTKDDYSHWDKKRIFLINHEKDFIAESLGEFHRRRLSEAEVLDDLAKKEKMRRYLYVIKKIGI